MRFGKRKAARQTRGGWKVEYNRGMSVVIGFVVAVGIWIYAFASWGFLIGLAIGWLPAAVGGAIVMGIGSLFEGVKFQKPPFKKVVWIIVAVVLLSAVSSTISLL